MQWPPAPNTSLCSLTSRERGFPSSPNCRLGRRPHCRLEAAAGRRPMRAVRHSRVSLPPPPAAPHVHWCSDGSGFLSVSGIDLSHDPAPRHMLLS
ncbi:hypothetical protein EJB05_26960 [Eragrostis curvula]|uniref:Uncharacterized protein n=1 Tax=Eragrostis curvula TaxID=38414 RepID=A0A5J9UMF4_9POAL|nr:hypothetical protein EJB05_26960 [Eragrostis curvula]